MSILLCTLNARYSHSSFGLRYLRANLDELRSESRILEFTLQQNPNEIVKKITSLNPKIVGFGVYIWNTAQTLLVVEKLKRERPDILVVLGGPEISFETDGQELTKIADHIICGEAEFLFRDFCRDYLWESKRPSEKTIRGPLPEITQLNLPYAEYTDEDIRHRVIYVEASRGCPYKCEYCLSSLDKSVRNFETSQFLCEMQRLIDRGARQFKFVDRTFNLSPRISSAILSFFLERMGLGLFLHFEMVPDRLPFELRELIQKFPPRSLQFEIGIQTWNPQVAALVSRRQDYSKICENFAFLREKTGVHTHADLIVGLPGEDLQSFAQGFDAVAELGADEIQVGILKRLKGTPIIRHDAEWQMTYSETPPFQILSTRSMDKKTLEQMSRFAKFWDLYANRGNFKRSMHLLKSSAKISWFWKFYDFVEYLNTRHTRTHSLSLNELGLSLWYYLTEKLGVEENQVRAALSADISAGGRRELPVQLKTDNQFLPTLNPSNLALPKRQRQHWLNN